MKIKQLKIKNFHGVLNEVILDIPVEDGCNVFNLFQVDGISFDEYNVINRFFQIIPEFLLESGDAEISPSEQASSEPIEITIALLDNNSSEICYNAAFYWNGFYLTESVVVNNKLAIYYHCDDNDLSFGPGFTGNGLERSMLSEGFKNIKYSRSGSLIFSVVRRGGYLEFMDLYKLLEKDLKVVYPFTRLPHYSKLYFENDRDYISNYLKSNYSKKVLDCVRELFTILGFDIVEITEDWRVITEQDPNGIIDISSHGSGFITLLNILPDLVHCCLEDNTECLVISNALGSLHPNLLRGLFDFIKEKIKDRKNTQIICSFNEIKL